MTRDIVITQGDKQAADDVMLASEVERYRLVKREQYEELYARGDFKALIHAMQPMQRFHFTADCLERALRYQTQRGRIQDRDEHAFVVSLRQYADGLISFRGMYVHWQKCEISFPARRLMGTEPGLWAANSSADWLRWKASKWGREHAEQVWSLDRAMHYLTHVSV